MITPTDVLDVDETQWELDEPASVSRAAEDAAAGGGVSTLAKATICRVIVACPVRLWPGLSVIVRRIWPGFRDA